jgi:hypothetical protein
MFFTRTWIKRLLSPQGRKARRSLSGRTRQTRRLLLEQLEDRTLLSTLTVVNTNDTGPGSLRAAIGAAAPGDTIVFDPSLALKTITLTSGELLISQALTITGPGASQLTISSFSSSPGR